MAGFGLSGNIGTILVVGAIGAIVIATHVLKRFEVDVDADFQFGKYKTEFDFDIEIEKAKKKKKHKKQQDQKKRMVQNEMMLGEDVGEYLVPPQMSTYPF